MTPSTETYESPARSTMLEVETIETSARRGIGLCVASSMALLCIPTDSQAKSPAPISRYTTPADTNSSDFGFEIGPHFSEVDNLELLVDQVRRLSTYENGWNGNDSLGPSSQALADAESFLRSISWRGRATPKISPASDGEVNFFWDTANAYIDLGFYGDSHYSFFAKGADGKMLSGDDVPVDDRTTSELIADLIVSTVR